MEKKHVIEFVLFGLLAIIALLFWSTEIGVQIRQKAEEPISNMAAGLVLFFITLMFLLMFIWLRIGTRSWYRAEGRFVNRWRAFTSRIDGPLAEYSNEHGKKQTIELPRMAVYLKEPLKLRISPKGKAIAEGPEWVMIIMATVTFVAALVTGSS
jgi:hypothetical protein